MSRGTMTRMDALDITDFLDSQQVGILSLADDDDGYGIPLSFVFDETDHSVYFRLGYGPQSRKRQFVEASNDVSFVVVDETAEGWKSVIARGQLEQLSDSNLDSTIVETVRKLEIPYFRVHDQSGGEVTFNILRLDVRELSGIIEG